MGEEGGNEVQFAEGFGINYKVLKIHNPWLREKHLNNKTKKLYTIDSILTRELKSIGACNILLFWAHGSLLKLKYFNPRVKELK